jgi:hypothetical protein
MCLYFGLLATILIVALWNVRFGEYNLNLVLSNLVIFSFCIFTIYIYYASLNSIDSANYELKFELIDSLTVNADFLFTVFIKFVKLFTDDYQVFRGIIGCIYLVPVLIIIKREGDSFNKPLFLLFALIYPFFQSIVAMRFTMASSIAVSVLYLYLKSDQKKWKCIGTLAALIVSSMIHDTNILYVVLFLFFLIYKKIENKQLMTVLLLAFDTLVIFLLRIGIASDFAKILVGETNAYYISIMEGAGIGFLISVFLQLTFLFLIRKVILEKKLEEDYDTFDNDVLILNYCSVIFLPLYAIDVIAFRLFRGLLLLNFLIIAKYYKGKTKDITLAGFLTWEVVCMLFEASGIDSIVSILLGGGNVAQKGSIKKHKCHKVLEGHIDLYFFNHSIGDGVVEV